EGSAARRARCSCGKPILRSCKNLECSGHGSRCRHQFNEFEERTILGEAKPGAHFVQANLDRKLPIGRRPREYALEASQLLCQFNFQAWTISGAEPSLY